MFGFLGVSRPGRYAPDGGSIFYLDAAGGRHAVPGLAFTTSDELRVDPTGRAAVVVRCGAPGVCDRVTASDAVTGALLWNVTSDEGGAGGAAALEALWTTFAPDGSTVAVVWGASGAVGSTLALYALVAGDGAPLWRVPAPIVQTNVTVVSRGVLAVLDGAPSSVAVFGIADGVRAPPVAMGCGLQGFAPSVVRGRAYALCAGTVLALQL